MNFDKRVELKVDEELYNAIEKYRIENNLDDKQDAIRKVLKENIKSKSFFEKLKDLF